MFVKWRRLTEYLHVLSEPETGPVKKFETGICMGQK